MSSSKHIVIHQFVAFFIWLSYTLLRNCPLKPKSTRLIFCQFSEVLDSTSSRGINIVAKEESFRKLTALLKLKGLSVVIANSEPTIIPAITKR